MTSAERVASESKAFGAQRLSWAFYVYIMICFGFFYVTVAMSFAALRVWGQIISESGGIVLRGDASALYGLVPRYYEAWANLRDGALNWPFTTIFLVLTLGFSLGIREICDPLSQFRRLLQRRTTGKEHNLPELSSRASSFGYYDSVEFMSGMNQADMISARRKTLYISSTPRDALFRIGRNHGPDAQSREIDFVLAHEYVHILCRDGYLYRFMSTILLIMVYFFPIVFIPFSYIAVGKFMPGFIKYSLPSPIAFLIILLADFLIAAMLAGAAWMLHNSWLNLKEMVADRIAHRATSGGAILYGDLVRGKSATTNWLAPPNRTERLQYLEGRYTRVWSLLAGLWAFWLLQRTSFWVFSSAEVRGYVLILDLLTLVFAAYLAFKLRRSFWRTVPPVAPFLLVAVVSGALVIGLTTIWNIVDFFYPIGNSLNDFTRPALLPLGVSFLIAIGLAVISVVIFGGNALIRRTMSHG
ncbi:MAG: M48 family metalloprotease [Pseudomonadota bacterium]|nr:M48 family metalloprotease [Pseudomonadota bacterium]